MHDDAHRHLATSDPRFAQLIARSRRYDPKKTPGLRPFDSLAESIVYQQLSGKAAATIWRRVREIFGSPKYLDPHTVIATSDEVLRAAGLSRNKTIALKDLAGKALEGIVPSTRELARMTDEEIIARLIQVRGIGRWTVEMMLLFDLGRPDVWPINDLGVQKGLAKTFGKRKLPTAKQMIRLGEKWRPYRSAAAWYFWRALDQPNRHD